MRWIFVLILFFPSHAFACFYYAPEKYSAPLDLIQRTQNIVLAKAIKAELKTQPKIANSQPLDRPESLPIKYTFEILETLKGQKEGIFDMDAHALEKNTHYNNHEDERFWVNDEGRMIFGSDCQGHEGFAVGSVYLMFLDRPYHRKSFERILRYRSSKNEDKWLSFVKDRTIHIRP